MGEIGEASTSAEVTGVWDAAFGDAVVGLMVRVMLGALGGWKDG